MSVNTMRGVETFVTELLDVHTTLRGEPVTAIINGMYEIREHIDSIYDLFSRSLCL